MEMLEIIKHRRSIRRYQDRQLPADVLQKILEAGIYAPNAGGRQNTIICALRDRKLSEQLGQINASRFNHAAAAGRHVSDEQPSIIDDPSIRSAFYGAPSVCVIFAPDGYTNSMPDAYCSATNMLLEASALEIGSCIVCRAEETFDSELGRRLMQEWEIPEGYVARCFVLLGYTEGQYPGIKPRKDGRIRIIE